MRSNDRERMERNERMCNDCERREWKEMRGGALKVIREVRGGQRHRE